MRVDIYVRKPDLKAIDNFCKFYKISRSEFYRQGAYMMLGKKNISQKPLKGKKQNGRSR